MTCSRRHVVITGASSGIGKATAELAASKGWHVFAWNRNFPEAVKEQLAEHGVVTCVNVDITDASMIADATRQLEEHLAGDGLDGLANVAGIGVPGPLEVTAIADLRASLEVDVIGQVAVTQALLPSIRAKAGRIVFIGSIADRTSIPFFGALAAAKSAIASVSDTFRQELAPWGIKVSLVEPGFISTGADRATKTRIDSLQASFTPEQASLYGHMFSEATERGYAVQTHGSAPDGVAAVIYEALTSRRPKYHYLTGSKAHLVAAAAKLPTGLADSAKRRAFGMPDPGQMSESE